MGFLFMENIGRHEIAGVRARISVKISFELSGCITVWETAG